MQLDNEEKKAIIWALDPDNGHADFWAVTELRDIFSNILAKPLFTTNDGIDIYEGDSFYYIPMGEPECRYLKYEKADKHFLPHMCFSNGSIAQRYLDNQPKYNINDLVKIANYWSSFTQDKETVLAVLDRCE